MSIYTLKCEQKWLKINRGGWNKDVLGGKKNEKLTIGEEGRLFGTQEYILVSEWTYIIA